MTDYLTPKPRTRTGYTLAVAVTGVLLVVSTLLPWAGVEARSDLIGGGLTDDMRGIDGSYGIYTLVAGLAVVAFGVAGLMGRRWLAALAVLPAALAVLVLVMFLSDSTGGASLDFGRLLSIEPVIRFGWYAALTCALAATLTSLLTLLRRRTPS
ncbi:hypothetical protein ACIBHX_29465 [Nonomuraea sp. NPDC050536]|uniref:hypothetical protein n=1 Tax=Nonomuraea sp. NPDC050536 TaxID=3364366 RepID=UPI0037CB87B2